jgi:hypothetical protein
MFTISVGALAEELAHTERIAARQRYELQKETNRLYVFAVELILSITAADAKGQD